MPREKTTQAKVWGMRLNPINEMEAQVEKIIREWEGKGFPFKALAMDRILRVEGFKPEMFTREAAPAGASYFAGVVEEMLQANNETIEQAIARQLEGVLTQFAEELTKELTEKLKTAGKYVSHDENEEEDNAGFGRNFARSFMQRQQKGKG